MSSIQLATQNGSVQTSLVGEEPSIDDSGKFDLSVDVDSDLEELLDDDSSESGGEGNDPDSIEDENAIFEKAESAWTVEEVDQMMTFLKERGMVEWMKEYLVKRNEPVQKLLWAFGVLLKRDLRQQDDMALLPLLKVALVRVLRSRQRLPQYGTIDDALQLLRNSKRIIVLTGAGISVSCGIPDFRSRDGLYAMLQERGEYELDDPQQMFDIHYFRQNPSVFYSFAHRIYPSNFRPSRCHEFIKGLETKGKLLRNYTQNIDTLETKAGIQRILQCHGSFATATCINCRHKVVGTKIEDDILNQRIPLCTTCNVMPPPVPSKKLSKKKTKKRKRTNGWNSDQSDESEPDSPPPQGIMKPDITFFGEKLTDDFDRLLFEDRESADLLLVIGTSLKVAPVSEILTHLPHSVPQIVINKTPIKHINPDILLLGDADGIVEYLEGKLNWCETAQNQGSSDLHIHEPQRAGTSHVWLFNGEEGGTYVEKMKAATSEDGRRDSPRAGPAKVDHVMKKARLA
ncbi:SIR2-domain-containing protein [Rickenella mellea]|uniref:SIR2-domain-containing protein n=1 Tax=Rickenella mellea TaxID=50990 RepID=A0A4Y7Q8V4_9AGAM|nr:SIR2-domain-containing protein [Rickenella mellea]